jgi:hypothetical protein
LAHTYPYTYTDLQTFIGKIKADPDRSRHLKHSVIGNSVAGNNIDLLCISQLTQQREVLMRRKSIVITARCHPGESSSSFLAQGFVEFLVSGSLRLIILVGRLCGSRGYKETVRSKNLPHDKSRYIYKELNISDGVICGNHRTNLKV